MAGMFAVLLFGQMYYMPYVLKGARDGMLHTKNKKLNRKFLFIISVLYPNMFFFMLGAGGYLKLSEWLWDDSVILVFFSYAVVNIVVQVILIKRENRKIDITMCNYCKMIWLVGMLIHSLLIFMALSNRQNVSLWMIGASIFYGIYNYGFLFFMYFTEKEILTSTCRERESLFLETEYVEHLRPLCRVGNEEYRQRIITETNWIIGLGFIFSFSICVIGAFWVVMWYRDSGGSVWGIFGMVPFLVGTVVFLRYFIKMDRDVKNSQFESVYEGGAQVFHTNPLIVKYFLADGEETIKRVDMQTRKAIPVGTFVGIVLENEEIVKIVVEDGKLV